MAESTNTPETVERLREQARAYAEEHYDTGSVSWCAAYDAYLAALSAPSPSPASGEALSQYGHDEIFNAIVAAVRLPHGGGISISVKAFRQALAPKPDEVTEDLGHKTRSSDASSFDEICDNCGATDRAGSDALSKPCPKPSPDRVMEGEDFLAQLRRVNGERWAAWANGAGEDPLYQSNEFGGEAGEVQNIVKKLVREQRGWRGSRSTPDKLADEIADCIICLDSIARGYGIDLAEATARKFNATSEANEFPHRLSTATPDARLREENEALRRALVDHNNMLRSACAVADRDGANTNWLTLRGAIYYTLAEHLEITNAARAALGGETKA